MNRKYAAVYVLASKPFGTLYIGLTTNLVKRIYQHKKKLAEGFTQKYSVDKLVYYELFEDMNSAIKRERNLKEWKRDWKIRLINLVNPEWKDLCDQLY